MDDFYFDKFIESINSELKNENLTFGKIENVSNSKDFIYMNLSFDKNTNLISQNLHVYDDENVLNSMSYSEARKYLDDGATVYDKAGEYCFSQTLIHIELLRLIKTDNNFFQTHKLKLSIDTLIMSCINLGTVMHLININYLSPFRKLSKITSYINACIYKFFTLNSFLENYYKMTPIEFDHEITNKDIINLVKTIQTEYIPKVIEFYTCEI